jgi:Galactosyltransferase
MTIYPKFLIAVKSCEADLIKGHNQVIRDTWGKNTHRNGFSLRFFIGRGNHKLGYDESRVDAPDDYNGLPQKTCAILRWALAKNYNFIYLCDTDTFVRFEMLMASCFERFDVTGYFAHRIPGTKDYEGYYAWPSGGAGYWVSARAAEFIANNSKFTDCAEDRMVGQILGPYIADGTLTAQNRKDYGAPHDFSGLVTAHYESRVIGREYDPQWMKDMHKKWTR